MGPVLVVMGFIIAQDLPQMGLVPDEGAVQEFAAASPDPASGDRVHPGRPDVAGHGPDAAPARTAPDAAVKSGPRSRMMNLTRCACSPGSVRRLRACCVVCSRPDAE